MEEQTGRCLSSNDTGKPHTILFVYTILGQFLRQKQKSTCLISAIAVLNRPSFLIEALKKPYVREENDNGKACVCLSNSLAKDCIFSYTSPMPLSSKVTSRLHYSFKNTFISII